MKYIKFIFIGFCACLLLFVMCASTADALCRLTGGRWVPSPVPPGGDHPDDTNQVPQASNINFNTNTNGTLNVLILKHGFYKQNRQALSLSVSGLNSFLAGETATPSQLSKVSNVLLIPSGGFYGLSNSSLLKATLEQYVSQGGILLMFSQQHGYEFSLLPGGQVQGNGWREDQSCFSNAAYIDTWHPILQHQTSRSLTGSVDGFFTNWPTNATLLYRKTRDNFPVALVYKYGNGYVFATTLYSDYAFSTGQFTGQEQTLIQDLLSWAKLDDKDVTTFPANTSVTLPVTLTNTGIEDATSVKLQIKDGATVLLEQEDAVTVSAGQTLSHDFNFTTPSDPSKLYDVFYQLINSQTQQLTYADNFLVRSPLSATQPQSDISFFITIPDETVVIGVPTLVSFHVRNAGDNTFYGSVLASSPEVRSYAVYPVTVPPGQEVSVAHQIIPAGSIAWRNYIGFLQLPDGTRVAEARTVFSVVTPKVSFSVNLDKGTKYRPGESVTGTLNIQNAQSVDFPAHVSFKVLTPSNTILTSFEKDITLYRNASLQEPISFTLPSPYGIYTLFSEAQSNGLIGAGTAFVEVETPRVFIEPLSPLTLSAGANTVSFTVRNLGAVALTQGNVHVTLVDGDGKTAAESTVSFALEPSEEKTLPVSLNITALSFTDYKLKYLVTTENGKVALGARSLPNTTEGTLDFNKLFYRAGETVSGTLHLINPSRFVQNLAITFSIPQLNFTQNTSAALSPNETKSLHFTASVPATTASGDVAVFAVLNLSNSKTIAKSLFIPDPSFIFRTEKLGYNHGESVPLYIKNQGGIPTTLNYLLKLADLEGTIFNKTTGSLSMPLDTEQSVSLSIPQGLKTQQYRLSFSYTDSKTAKKNVYEKVLFVQGISAQLSVSTDKGAYSAGETVNVTSTVTPNTPLTNTTTKIRIYKPGESFTSFPQIGMLTSILPEKEFVYFGTMTGLVKYDKTSKQWSAAITTANGLSHNHVMSLASDADAVWVGTADGLTRFAIWKTLFGTEKIPFSTGKMFSGTGQPFLGRVQEASGEAQNEFGLSQNSFGQGKIVFFHGEMCAGLFRNVSLAGKAQKERGFA